METAGSPETLVPTFYSEIGGWKFLWNIGTSLPRRVLMKVIRFPAVKGTGS